MNHLNIYLK